MTEESIEGGEMNKEERKRLAFQEKLRAKMLENPLVSEIELPPPKGGEMNHTPGQWKVDNSNPHTLYVSSNEYAICALANDFGNPNMLQANAKLIAAAPDLLEACKAAQEAFNYMERTQRVQIIEVISAVDAAIDKATQ